ncbi:TraY domain-containing protein [Serratia fonticola]|uniref:TraY domain-containing protein n=1 Tax=Serratia fonticola TaxID=47917 RepID=UPI001F4572BD|nr:TraY domain-containing protein [Serratia fonticola]
MRLSPNVNRLLTESAIRTGRSKTQEALLRLTDHLINFEDIASEGKRFLRNDK